MGGGDLIAWPQLDWAPRFISIVNSMANSGYYIDNIDDAILLQADDGTIRSSGIHMHTGDRYGGGLGLNGAGSRRCVLRDFEPGAFL